MKPHARNLAVSTGATEDLIDILVLRVIEERYIGMSRTKELPKDLKSARKEK